MNWSSTGLHIAIPTDGPRKGRSKGVGRGVAGLAKAVAGFAEWRTGVRRVDENCLSIKEVPIRLADGTRSLPAVLVCPPAEVLVGQGDARQYIPARVEVTGALDGWDFSVQRVGEASREPERPDNVIITLSGRSGSRLASPTRWTLKSQPSNAPVTSTRAGMYWRASPWPTSTSAGGHTRTAGNERVPSAKRIG